MKTDIILASGSLIRSTLLRNSGVVFHVKKHKIEKNVFPNKIDLVTGGFPCQDFSVSGLRKGFSSHKSHLNDYNVLN